jgi:decaprenyl-phosphate phosphoribosyltransferase
VDLHRRHDDVSPDGDATPDKPVTRSSLAVGIIRSLRPHQWTKNVLVFAAPVAAGTITEGDLLLRSVLAFVAFCAAASGTYLLNDSRDVESDRLHPTKCNRPIAAGIVAVPVAIGLGLGLIVFALALGTAVARDLGLTLAAYLLLTTAYTYALKRMPVYDIVAVAAGFVLRAVAGATATDVAISQWFFIVTSFGALLMVVGKREGERALLADQAASVRSTLGAYTENYLIYLRSVASGVVMIGYCLWAFESATNVGQGSNAQIWFQLSIVPFSVAILRYALLLDRGEGAEPERLVLSDRPLLAAGACWAIIYAYGVYLA